MKNIKELLKLVGDKRLTDKLVKSLIIIDDERKAISKRTEVAHIDNCKIDTIDQLLEQSNDIKREFGYDLKIEINEYEILFYGWKKYTETDYQVINRIKENIKSARKMLKQVQTASAKLEELGI